LKIRIGIGYDLHRLVPGRRFVLGGVEIPFRFGPDGHSDADVLIHALIDALLGAAGEGDIGRLFPDTDPEFKDARSMDLLAAVMKILRRKGFEVVHADTVVVCEEPAVAPRVADMKKALCPLLGLAPGGLGIKGKTNEGIGEIGKGEAVACWATVLVREKPRKAKKKAAEFPLRKVPRPSAD
jgi:2-C-methyl-D-erythritol 2,4-cyclodiphosphate synthase